MVIVRNTVARATIEVDGKHQILGTRNPQTPWAIHFKFDADDYGPHCGMKLQAILNGPLRAAQA